MLMIGITASDRGHRLRITHTRRRWVSQHNNAKTLRMEHVQGLTSLGQLGHHNKAKALRMEHVNGRKFTEKKKNKVEEIHLANLASLGSIASKNRCIMVLEFQFLNRCHS